MDAQQIAGAPFSATLGGTVYHFKPITLYMLGRLQARVAEKRVGVFLRSCPNDYDPKKIAVTVKALMDDADNKDMEAAMKTPDGIVYMLWLSSQGVMPNITEEQVGAAVMQASEAEVEALVDKLTESVLSGGLTAVAAEAGAQPLPQ